MNTKLIVSGALAALLAISMSANAYHIKSDPANTVAGADPHTFDSVTSVSLPVGEPCEASSPASGPCATLVGDLEALPYPVGDGGAPVGAHGILTQLLGNGCLFAPCLAPNAVLFAETLCEHNDVLGFGVSGTIVSAGGHGGLCFMSPGYTGSPCAQSGYSNGFGPNYDNHDSVTTDSTDCENVARGDPFGIIATRSHDYVRFTMQDGNNNDIVFTGQVNGISCSSAGKTSAVDMQYAYETDGGHVAGFASGLVSGVGTYTVTGGQGTVNGDCQTGTPAPIYFSA